MHRRILSSPVCYGIALLLPLAVAVLLLASQSALAQVVPRPPAGAVKTTATAGDVPQTHVGAAPRPTETPPTAGRGPGAPMYVPEDEHWDSRFGTFGTDGRIYALAKSGGNMYVAGNFDNVAGVQFNGIARWDGTHWNSLGGGVAGDVFAMAISGTNVYIGGVFGEVDGVAATNVAMWDGSKWSALGGGVTGPSFTQVLAIALVGDNVYVGGIFSKAGEVDAANIARWDGNQWHALGSGVRYTPSPGYIADYVTSLVARGNDLYVGGSFNTAGEIQANNIAKWDGSQWSALDGGVDRGVSALATNGTDIYVGGYFLMAGDTPARRVARWNGSQWSAVGSGIDGNQVSIRTMEADGDCLYVGGNFTVAGEVAANNVARWDGEHWFSLGRHAANGTSGIVNALAIDGNLLYAGGRFDTAGGITVSNLARWNGSIWSRVTDPSAPTSVHGLFGGPGYALAVLNGSVYVGGEFDRAGTSMGRGVARWTGSEWSGLGNPPYQVSPVYAMAGAETDLYVGGNFYDIYNSYPSVPANGVARWDGEQWSALGSGVSDPTYVDALAVTGTQVYAGGLFTRAGGITANRVARWDGSQWHPLSSNGWNGTNGRVYAIATQGDDVYVGGQFSIAGGVVANGIARWDGTQWHPLGNGVGGSSPASVHAILVDGDDVYVGGKFTTAGEETAHNIARWDGSQWHSIGEGFPGDTFEVYSLALGESGLYAGGTFHHSVARWDGSSWQRLGSGTYGPPLALVTLGRDLYAAGDFDEAGTKPSYYFAIWHEPAGAPPTPTPLPCSAGEFADATACSTFYSYVTCLSTRHVVSGYPCGTRPGEPCDSANRPYFRPGEPVTRGQLTKLVTLAAGFEETFPPDRQTYADVAPGSPFWRYIESLSSRGVMSGYPCGGPGEPCGTRGLPYFRPGANVSRGQTAKIVSNTAGYDEPIAKCQQTFADVPQSGAGSTFWEYVERLAGRSVMSGYACGGEGEECDSGGRAYFRPGSDVTRGQSSKIVANTFYPNCQTPSTP